MNPKEVAVGVVRFVANTAMQCALTSQECACGCQFLALAHHSRLSRVEEEGQQMLAEELLLEPLVGNGGGRSRV